MSSVKTNQTGDYQPQLIKPIIHITNEPAPYWLVYSKSREQEYTILCKPLEVQGKGKLKGLKEMRATVYYSKLAHMDEDGKALIRDYLIQAVYENPNEENGFQSIAGRFGESAAWDLFNLRYDIQKQSCEWRLTQIGAMELREPVAYLWTDFDEWINYQLPEDLYDIAKGMYYALRQSKLKSENYVHAAFYAGYLKGSRETGQPIPPLIKGGEAAQNLIFAQYDISL